MGTRRDARRPLTPNGTRQAGNAPRGRLPFTGQDTMFIVAAALGLLVGTALLMAPPCRRRLGAYLRRHGGPI